MNAAEELSTAIGRKLPDALVTIDAPTDDSGYWWIDIKRGDRHATVEWRPKQGFGVGLGLGGYGEGPDIVVSTVEAATRHVDEYLSSSSAIQNERTVLVASADFTWRSEVEAHLRQHHVWADAVATFADASNRILRQTYLVVVIDLAIESAEAYWHFREVISKVDSLVVTVATSEQVSTIDGSFEFVVHKRIGTEYVASVVEGLVAAAATG